jgi:hypothetical protein
MAKKHTPEITVNDHHLRSIADEDWNTINAIRNQAKLTWGEFFHKCKDYSNGIQYIMDAPEFNKALKLDVNTAMGLIREWLENARQNWVITQDLTAPHPHGYTLEQCRTVLDLLKDNPWQGKPAIVMGAGPSLLQNHLLEQLAASHFGGPVLSCGHSLKWCYERGVYPHFSNIIDSNEKLLGFIDDPIIDVHCQKTKMIFANSVNPWVIKRWKGERYFILTSVPNNLIPNVDNVVSDLLPHLPMMDTGGNSGAFMYALAALLKCDPICTIGIDFSYPEGTPYEETQYHMAWMQSVGTAYKDEADMIQQIYHHGTHPVFKTKYYTDFVYEVFLSTFTEMAKIYRKQAGITTINATEGGAIAGPDILCMTFRDFLEEYSE